MDQFTQIFKHYNKYKVIVCRNYRTDIVSAHIITHLTKSHSDIRPKTRREVTEVAQQANKLAHAPEDVRYPAAKFDHISELEVWTDGYKCTYKKEKDITCGFIQRALRNI